MNKMSLNTCGCANDMSVASGLSSQRGGQPRRTQREHESAHAVRVVPGSSYYLQYQRHHRGRRDRIPGPAKFRLPDGNSHPKDCHRSVQIVRMTFFAGSTTVCSAIVSFC